MANARARMSKLEAAMSAVGEEDPIYPGLLEAFKKVRAQTQTKPVRDRIAGQNSFWSAPGNVSKVAVMTWRKRVALVAAEAKLVSDLRQEEAGGGVQESPPATIPANFAQELAQLRDFVSELERERDELRMELAGRALEDARPRKTNKSLSTPSLELEPVRSQVGSAAQGSGKDFSTMMETLIDQAESAARSGSSATLMNLS